MSSENSTRTSDQPPGSTAPVPISIGFGTIEESGQGQLSTLDIDLELTEVSIGVARGDVVVVAGCSVSPCDTTRLLRVSLESGLIDEQTLDYHLSIGGYDPTGTYLLGTDRTNGVPIIITGADASTATRIPIGHSEVMWAAW